MPVMNIQSDRIQPERSDQNGGHERMHRNIRLKVQGLVERNLDHQSKIYQEQLTEMEFWLGAGKRTKCGHILEKVLPMS